MTFIRFPFIDKVRVAHWKTPPGLMFNNKLKIYTKQSLHYNNYSQVMTRTVSSRPQPPQLYN